MKKLHFIAAMLLCQLLCAQNWTNLPGAWYQSINNFYEDTINNRLLAFGGFDSVGTVQAQGIAAWDGENWSRLPNWPNYPTNTGITVGAIVRHNGDLYMGCGAPSWNYHCYLSRYNGITFDTIARFAIGLPTTLLEYQNDIIACTHWSDDSVNGIPFDAVARWNGTNWSDIGQGTFYNGIYDGVIYNGDIYVSSLSSIDQRPYIFRYRNSAWQIVGQQFSGIVFHLCVYNGTLYAGSYNNQSSWGNAIVKLDTLTDTWKIPGGGLASTSLASWAQVDGMTVSNGALYVLGYFDHAGGVPAVCVSKWDGTQWCGLGVNLNTYQCRTIGTFRDTIYISTGLIFDNDSSDNFVKWNGGNYTDTCGFLTTGIIEHAAPTISVYPNPVTETTTFQMSGLPGNKTLQIFDSFGKEIWRKETAEQEIVFSANGFAPGIYFYRLEQDGEIQTSGKFIIQR